jgi:hypothetical protein
MVCSSGAHPLGGAKRMRVPGDLGGYLQSEQ